MFVISPLTRFSDVLDSSSCHLFVAGKATYNSMYLSVGRSLPHSFLVANGLYCPCPNNFCHCPTHYCQYPTHYRPCPTHYCPCPTARDSGSASHRRCYSSHQLSAAESGPWYATVEDFAVYFSSSSSKPAHSCVSPNGFRLKQVLIVYVLSGKGGIVVLPSTTAPLWVRTEENTE